VILEQIKDFIYITMRGMIFSGSFYKNENCFYNAKKREFNTKNL